MAKVRFLAHGRDWVVEVPVGTSLLQASKTCHAPEGDACGGVCACSTCHVVVKQGLESIPEATDDENDQLDNAPGLTPQSRLSCQSVPDGSVDLVVEIPSWNRNLVKEDH